MCRQTRQYDKANKATAGILLARKRLHRRMAVKGNIGRAKRAEGGKLFEYVHKVGNVLSDDVPR